MESASLPIDTGAARRGRRRKSWRPIAFLTAPTVLLSACFLLPMCVMLVIASKYGLLSGDSGFTLTNFTDVLTDPLYLKIAWTTIQIATAAMLVQLLIAVPVAL